MKKKYFLLSLAVLISFSAGYFTCSLIGRDQNASTDYIVDFNENKEVNDGHGENFIRALGLFYLYQKETSNYVDVKKYLDTLTYYRKNLLIHHIDNRNNYLIFYKPSFYKEYDDAIYGFTKDSFYVFEKRKIEIRNYPVSAVRRGEEF